jgi:hypothetical protein
MPFDLKSHTTVETVASGGVVATLAPLALRIAATFTMRPSISGPVPLMRGRLAVGGQRPTGATRHDCTRLERSQGLGRRQWTFWILPKAREDPGRSHNP